MPKKYGSSIYSFPINIIFKKNLEFWDQNGGKIKGEHILKNGRVIEFKIRHKPSMKIYGFSYGETYHLRFAYDPEFNKTYATVKAKFSMFGRGAVWKFANDMIKKWANYLGADLIKLSSKKNEEYKEIQERIAKIKYENNGKAKYCIYCGTENDFITLRCVKCGSELK